jgi:hypothetical protein
MCQEYSEELERVTQRTCELQVQLVEALARLVQSLDLIDLQDDPCDNTEARPSFEICFLCF